jgi:hypothetical protein
VRTADRGKWGKVTGSVGHARPYTGIAAPLVGAESVLARNRITLAMSAGATQRE